jgi:hypothetical protein
MSTMAEYRLACWRHGFLDSGYVERSPHRQLQALIRYRGAEADAIERWLILCDIRAMLAEETVP